MNKPDKVQAIVLMTAASRDSLNERQLGAHESHRRDFLLSHEWVHSEQVGMCEKNG